MKKLSRRRFLKGSLAAGAMIAFAGRGTVTAKAMEQTDKQTIEQAENGIHLPWQPPRMVLQLDNPIVEINNGKLRGFIDRGVYTFRGIPYAKAERFGLPQKLSPWNNIKNCYTYGGQCPQKPSELGASELLIPHLFWPSDENCQVLNIWSKDISGEKKPVMIWIHGGSYSTGSAMEQPCYDGYNLCNHGDVVVVSINHRLNCLGFMDLSEYGDEYVYTGNLGLLDIVAALQWVHENISRFGGDPDNITLFGQSGGGRKILNLMSMPLADGLFHKVILESCGASGIPQEEARMVTKCVFKTLGLVEGDVESLKLLPYEQLRLAGDTALAQVGEALGRSIEWYPVIDGACLPVDNWTNDPNNHGKNIPMIIGSNFAERTGNAYPIIYGMDGAKNTWNDARVDQELSTKYGDKKDAVISAFQHAYPNKPIIDAAYVTLDSYRGEVLDVLHKRTKQTLTGGAPVYNYIFSYEFPVLGGILPWHCAELPFVFGNVELQAQSNGATDEGLHLSNQMLKAWTTFAHTGNPNHTGMIEWPAYTEAEGACILFEPEMYIGYHHDAELRKIVLDI